MQQVLEELLLRARLVDAARLKKATDVVHETGCTLAHALVKLGLVSDRGLAKLLSQALNLRVVDPTRLDIPSNAVAALAGPTAYRLRVMPVRLRSTAEGEFFYVAMSDPTDRAAVREVEALTARELVPAIAEEKALERALRKHYASEALKPLAPQMQPRPVDEEEPPVVVGLMEPPPTDPLQRQAERDAARARLGSDDDESYFTESTEELMTVYSRALARAQRGADDDDLNWLKERQGLLSSSAPPVVEKRSSAPVSSSWPPVALAKEQSHFEDARTQPVAARELEAVTAPRRAVPLPVDAVNDSEARTEPDLSTALADARQLLFRPPTCIVLADKTARGELRTLLAGHIAALYDAESIDAAVELGAVVPLGYVVVVRPRAEPTVAKKLERLRELAGAPKVLVIGGEAAFQVVPGVDHWIEASAKPAMMAAQIVGALRALERT